MDHLFVPSNPKHPQINVPLRAKESYAGPFNSFLDRYGWNRSSVASSSVSEAQVEELQSLLQTWLFFGLLEEVFGPSCAVRVALLEHHGSGWVRRGETGQNAISTAPLRPLLARLSDSDIPKAQLSHIRECLTTATDVVNSLSLSNSPLIETPEVLAIAVLCDAIGKSLGTDRGAFRAGGELALGVPRYLTTRMLGDGWCRNDVARLRGQLDLPLLYFASNLDPPEQQVSHAKCTETICQASQVDESRYATVHDTPACDGNCPFIPASQEELAAILLSGAVPLIDYNPDEEPNTLRLVPAASGLAYVAISHVWSHGLGNQIDNAVPRCQLGRISKLVNQLPREPGQTANLFWLDTICFPLHHPGAADRALVYMRRTYQDATKVLVIDRYLTATKAKNLLYTEILLRILCSSWTRRLWTLQEGVLARKLFFQFADGSVDMQCAELCAMAEIRHGRSLEYLPVQRMASELWEAWKTRDSEDPKSVLNYLAGALRWRATSQAADEALCLATLLGLDMEALMDGPAETRMGRLWALMPTISAQAVFWSGQRLDSDGLRWAPSSFLGQSSAILQDLDRSSYSEMMPLDGSVRLTDRGLHFRCAGILLNTWRAPLERDIWIKLVHLGWFRLRRQASHRLDPKTDEDGDYCRGLVLLMKTSIAAAFSADRPERSVTCILASIYDVDEEDDVIFANTEDVGFLLPVSREARYSTEENLHERVAELSELQLAALGTVESGASESQAPGSSTVESQGVREDVPPTASKAAVISSKGASIDALTSKMRLLLAEDEELRTARMRARDENGRLSVDKDGKHYLFYGAELAEDQEWCLD